MGHQFSTIPHTVFRGVVVESLRTYPQLVKVARDDGSEVEVESPFITVWVGDVVMCSTNHTTLRTLIAARKTNILRRKHAS